MSDYLQTAMRGPTVKKLPGGGLSVKKHPVGVLSEEPECWGNKEEPACSARLKTLLQTCQPVFHFLVTVSQG